MKKVLSLKTVLPVLLITVSLGCSFLQSQLAGGAGAWDSQPTLTREPSSASDKLTRSTPLNTATPSPPTLTATLDISSTPQEKTLVQPTATLDTLRRTPPTLMLHKSNPNFDAVKFLSGMVRILKEKDFKVVTYQQISNQPDITATEEGGLFIISIDDINLQSKIHTSIQEMIAILLEAGYPAVLGVVTEGKIPDPETAAILKNLSEKGWEIAMHGDTHTNLRELGIMSIYGARMEIKTCADKIEQVIGKRPITLILPYGDMVEEFYILQREGVIWAVGIVKGEKYRTTHVVYYVGREGPTQSPEVTFRVMMERFNNLPGQEVSTSEPGSMTSTPRPKQESSTTPLPSPEATDPPCPDHCDL